MRSLNAPLRASGLSTPYANDDSKDEDYRASFGSYTVTSTSERQKQKEQEAELDAFITSTVDLSAYRDKPLRWWQERGQALYPTLATLAFDIFAIPGMSSECERAFSYAKKLVTDDRYNIKPDIIEAEQCLKSWSEASLLRLRLRGSCWTRWWRRRR